MSFAYRLLRQRWVQRLADSLLVNRRNGGSSGTLAACAGKAALPTNTSLPQYRYPHTCEPGLPPPDTDPGHIDTNTTELTHSRGHLLLYNGRTLK